MSTRAEIKIDGLPDDYAYTDMRSFIEFLVDHLVVDIPNEITNVVMSATQPGDNERDSVWLRRNNAGSFIGIYLYSNGAWSQFFPAPGEIVWLRGDSRNPPAGYRVIESGTPGFTDYEVAFYTNKYLQKEGDTYYIYYAATFTGI